MIPKQLQEEVYNCIKCGICMYACPVYRQVNVEGASPRGKVQLIKKIQEGKFEPTEGFKNLLFTCLLCETCTVNCPSGVHVDRLLKSMRAEIVKKFKLPWQKRLAFSLLCSEKMLPLAMAWGRVLGNPLMSLLPKKGKLGTVSFSKLPKLNKKPLLDQYPEVMPSEKPAGKVLYFPGCATNYIFENIGHSTIKVLKKLGVEIYMPKDQMCCGLPIFLAGARDTALGNIRKNLEIFGRKDVDAIIIDCATCGSALKEEYFHILDEMGEDTGAVKKMSGKVMDITQYLKRFDLKKYLHPVKGRVTYHDPCHLVRSQKVRSEPRDLLRQIPGMEFAEMIGADVCCGGGGSFQIDHADVASGITAKKMKSIADTGAGIVASGCPGCRLQIYGNSGKMEISVVHPIELLAKAMD
jgi:glycolate oxidase iron-sulfur subunit